MLPFDPQPTFRFADVFQSIDNKVPSAVMAEIERMAIDEVGWASFAVPGGNLIVYTAALDGENAVVGRLVLSPARFDVTSEMVHNLYVRYTRERILQFFFHLGWTLDLSRAFVNRFEGELLASRARGLTVKELLAGLRDEPLRRFWNGFLCAKDE